VPGRLCQTLLRVRLRFRGSCGHLFEHVIVDDVDPGAGLGAYVGQRR
jgi:hypothetical protein